jgi:hypothetical protein
MKSSKTIVPKDGPAFEYCCRNIEKAISKTFSHARTNEGTQSFKWLLQDKYGASEEDTAKFLDTLFWEQGIDAAQRDGTRKAQTHEDFRKEWQRATGTNGPPKEASKRL